VRLSPLLITCALLNFSCNRLTRPANASLELQDMCAKQARKAYEADRLEMPSMYTKSGMASFTNHYNVKLNKCFIDIGSMASGSSWEEVKDAFESKVYATYIWSDVDNKPIHCEVLSLSGETKQCKSADEFQSLIKPYMDQ
jgi:hypothetical protein